MENNKNLLYGLLGIMLVIILTLVIVLIVSMRDNSSIMPISTTIETNPTYGFSEENCELTKNLLPQRKANCELNGGKLLCSNITNEVTCKY